MAICQFFLRGNCKFGSRCRNEHHTPNQRQYNDGYDQYENHNEYRRNNHDRYEESQRNNQGRKQKNRTWNRFEALDNGSQDIEIQSDDDKMIAIIQEDMKNWANQKMWAYSCYSPTAEKPCLEGLPDISPEEFRVLFSFHDLRVYESILSETNALYMRKKEELFEMNGTVRASVLNYLSTEVDPNPSLCITIYEMYGPNTGPQLPQNSFKDEIQIVQSTTLNSEMEENNTIKLPNKQTSPVVPQTVVSLTPKTNTQSIFGGSKDNTTENVDVTYTNISLLTDSEIKEFQNSKFELGKIPMRPPPKQFCHQNNFR